MACAAEEQAVADAMAALTLAQITWAIEQAQATLALMDINIKQQQLAAAQMALNNCQMGGGMGMRHQEGAVVDVVGTYQAMVQAQQATVDAMTKLYGELMAKLTAQ